MNLKKLIMLGFFALTLVACGGGSTSQDGNDNNNNNGGGNPGGNPNPPVVTPVATPVATPVPTPVPTPGEAEVVITDADIDSSPRAICLEFTNQGVCVKKTLCVPADNEAHLVCRTLNYLTPPTLLRTDADGTKHYSVCYLAPEIPAGLVCHEETVSPPPAPPAGGGDQGGGRQGGGGGVMCQFIAGQGLVCQDNQHRLLPAKCLNAAYRANNPSACGNGNLIPAREDEEAAPAGGNGGGNYQLPEGAEFCWTDLQGIRHCSGDSDDSDDEATCGDEPRRNTPEYIQYIRCLFALAHS